jgi:nuclear pore complex protein Nup53
MGDPVSASPSQRHWSSSPPKSHLGGHNVSHVGSCVNSPCVQKLSRTESLRGRHDRYKDKPSAPPVCGLIESVSGAGPSTLHNRLPEDNCSIDRQDGSFALSFIYNRPSDVYYTSGNQSSYLFNQSTTASPAQLDPFYTQGESLSAEDTLDETWVTIFGFPPAATSFILQEFSQYGNILKHVVAPEGNWLHVRYQSKLQAKKALSKNGKVFNGTIMVGVTTCVDKKVMQSDKENTSVSFMSPTVARTALDQSANFRPSSIRPLTSSFRSSAADSEVVQKSRAPQRSNSIVSKAMEYMFNW